MHEQLNLSKWMINDVPNATAGKTSAPNVLNSIPIVPEIMYTIIPKQYYQALEEQKITHW